MKPIHHIRMRAALWGVLGMTYLAPAPTIAADHCQPYWTAAYKCSQGCGCGSRNDSGGRGRGGPTREEIEVQAAKERASVLYQQGIDAWNQGQWGIAAEQFRQAYANNPDSKVIFTNFVNALHKVGLVAMEEGDWEYALSIFQSASLHKPDSREFKAHLALVQQKVEEQRQRAEAQRKKAREERQDIQRSNNAYAQYEQGRLAAERGDWATAEHYFRAALQIYPAESAYLKSVALAKNKQGDQARNKGDFATALAYWKSTLETDPANAYARTNAAMAQRHLDEKVVATRVQGDVNKIAEDLKNSKPTGDLDFRDFNTGRGPFGERIAKPTLIPAQPGKPGTNTKAGDQLKAAAAQAAFEADLRIIYDQGGAPNAGSLSNISAFSERARKDPQLMTLVRDLAELQVKRSQLESERTQLEQQRNLATGTSKMQELSDLVSKKEQESQANLKAIVTQTERVEERHREVNLGVDFKEDAPPQDLPQGEK